MIKYHFSKTAKRRAQLRILQALIAVILGLALAGAVILWQVNKDETRRIQLQHEARQANPTPEVPPSTKSIGGAFTLTNQDGQTVTSAEFHDKYMWVYFGYTYCPDLCPTGLQSLAHALHKLGPDTKKIQTLFITIDPVRDTPEKMKAYVASFHPDIMGLTGTPEQIATVAKAYQVYYARGEQVDEHDYIMDHSSLIYFMGPEGRFIAAYPENADPRLLVNALKEQWETSAPAAK